jgi:V-type H+-transporting ATPase proteolipid subunit
MADIVPVIMAGIIGIYGLVVSVLISDGLKQTLPLYTGFIQLGAGLSVGLAGLAAGLVHEPLVHTRTSSEINRG